ncbi:MAG: hypothetical protein ACRD36_11790, partial [Candidatus Acidiferrum sp.]
IMWSNPEARDGTRPPGIGLLKTQLLFPISNELAIIGAFELDDGDEADADEQLVAQINGSIVLHAMKQVYSRDSNFTYMMKHHTEIMRGVDLLNDQCFSWART